MPASLFFGPNSRAVHPRRDSFRTAAWRTGFSHRMRRGFTLVELLAVVGVVATLLAVIAPAFVQVDTAQALDKSAYDLSGLLEEARAYAKANNTYTWVGFYEEAADGNAGSPAIGRIVASAVASKDATAIYPVIGDQAPLTASDLLQIGKLVKIDNTHLTVLAPSQVPSRGQVPGSAGTLGPVSNDYQVGSDGFAQHSSTSGSGVNNVTFNYPIGAAAGTAGTYQFVKIIQFNPGGDATKIVDTPTQLMEIDLWPTHGVVPDTATTNCVAIQIAGIGGQVRIYRP